jgi:hypothetical protein
MDAGPIPEARPLEIGSRRGSGRFTIAAGGGNDKSPGAGSHGCLIAETWLLSPVPLDRCGRGTPRPTGELLDVTISHLMA